MKKVVVVALAITLVAMATLLLISVLTPKISEYEITYSVHGYVEHIILSAEMKGWMIYGEGQPGAYIIYTLESPRLNIYEYAKGVAIGTAFYTKTCTPQGCKVRVDPLDLSLDKFVRDKTTPQGQCSHLGYKGTLRLGHGQSDASEVPIAPLPGRVRYKLAMCEYGNIPLTFSIEMEYLDEGLRIVVDFRAESISKYNQTKYWEIYSIIR